MKVKLLASLAGVHGRSMIPRQIIECPKKVGERWITRGVAEEAPKDAKVDGVFNDTPPVIPQPKRRPAPETATMPKGETPEDTGPTCAGVTKAGNPCKRTRVAGSSFCAAHGAE